MELFKLKGCCGVRELHGLSEYSTPERAMAQLGQLLGLKAIMVFNDQEHVAGQNVNWRHLLFGQNRTNTYGDRFRAYILEHKLGTVVETDTQVNPNSGNPLKIFVWTVDWPALLHHLHTLRPELKALKKIDLKECYRVALLNKQNPTEYCDRMVRLLETNDAYLLGAIRYCIEHGGL